MSKDYLPNFVSVIFRVFVALKPRGGGGGGGGRPFGVFLGGYVPPGTLN